MNRGFLRTGAPFSSDLTLVVEIGMGLALLAGMLLARRRRYRAHAWCQSTVVLLNQAAIALTMAPSFRRSFALPIPAVFGHSYYAFTALHAALGIGPDYDAYRRLRNPSSGWSSTAMRRWPISPTR